MSIKREQERRGENMVVSPFHTHWCIIAVLHYIPPLLQLLPSDYQGAAIHSKPIEEGGNPPLLEKKLYIGRYA